MYIFFTKLKNNIILTKKNLQNLEIRPKFLLDFLEFDKKNGNLFHFFDEYYTHILLFLLASKRLVVIITQNEDFVLAIILHQTMVVFFMMFFTIRFTIMTNALLNIKTIWQKNKQFFVLGLLFAMFTSTTTETDMMMKRAGEALKDGAVKAGKVTVSATAADAAAKQWTGHAPSDATKEYLGPKIDAWKATNIGPKPEENISKFELPKDAPKK